jgi:hypothetical protein
MFKEPKSIMHMRSVFQLFTGLLLGSLLFSSCAKKDIDSYSNDPRLFFQIPGSGSIALRDSLIYSFPAKPNVGEQDTLWFKACIMGETANYDREIGIKINSATSTAKEGVNFKFERKILPADSFSVRVPLVVYRKGLKDTSVRLEFEVAENKHFKVGYERYKKAIFIWGDKFLKPDIWDAQYKKVFGEFTETRYAFILQTCNITELPDPTNITLLGFYNALVRKALYDLNARPGAIPMTDQLGVVVFPIYTGVGGVG